MKLYKAQARIDVVILASSEDEAQEFAERAAKDEISGDGGGEFSHISCVQEVNSVNELPHLWDGEALPWISDEDAWDDSRPWTQAEDGNLDCKAVLAKLEYLEAKPA